jgi:hypothetical protein
LLQLYIQIRAQLCNPCRDRDAAIFLRSLSGAFIANLIALLVSGAEITQPRLWILLGMLLATIRYNWLVERCFVAPPADATSVSISASWCVEAGLRVSNQRAPSNASL